jgi:K+-sensing histidine kinase KdpD
MGRPDASPEWMVSVTKRYGLPVVLVLSAQLVRLLVRPETLVGPVFLLAVLLSAWLGGMGPGLVAALLATLTINYFFLPPKYTLRRVDLYRTLVALVTRLDPSRANRPVSPDAVALTH